MSICVLGMSEEFKGKVAVNALWPRTLIATAAVNVRIDPAFRPRYFECISHNFNSFRCSAETLCSSRRVNPILWPMRRTQSSPSLPISTLVTFASTRLFCARRASRTLIGAENFSIIRSLVLSSYGKTGLHICLDMLTSLEPPWPWICSLRTTAAST
jgi:hypothetical protein